MSYVLLVNSCWEGLVSSHRFQTKAAAEEAARLLGEPDNDGEVDLRTRFWIIYDGLDRVEKSHPVRRAPR